MRSFRIVVFLALFAVSTFASDLKIKVVDPRSAAVVGAEVSVYRGDTATPAALVISSGEGLAIAPGLPNGNYRLEVRAPGFAVQSSTVRLFESFTTTVQLAVAAASETVVVTATRTPLPTENAGASISTLESGQLEVMQQSRPSMPFAFCPAPS